MLHQRILVIAIFSITGCDFLRLLFSAFAMPAFLGLGALECAGVEEYVDGGLCLHACVLV